MIYFVTYEKLKYMIAHPSSGSTVPPAPLSFSDYLLCSSISGGIAAAVSNIVDVVKTRVQVQGDSSALLIIRSMWTLESGPMAFTKGMGARMLWVTPSVAISMTLYETFKSHRLFISSASQASP